MRKNTLFVFVFFFFFLFCSFSSIRASTEKTVERQLLEVKYPEIAGTIPLYIEKSTLPDYIIYLVQFLIVLSIAITVICIFGAGFSWLTANNDPNKIKEGKERFASALFGLIIVFFSFLFLTSINPTMVELDDLKVSEIEEPFPPGVYLSTEEVFPQNYVEGETESTHRITTSSRDMEELGEGIKTIRIANHLDENNNVLGYYYAVVLHESPAFRGRCAFFINDTNIPLDFAFSEKFSSITIVQVNAFSNNKGKVVAYEKPSFNTEYPFQELNLSTREFSPLSINGVWSIDIEGNYGVILSSGSDWNSSSNGCGIFFDTRPIYDLKGHSMNQCNTKKAAPFYAAYESCATHYIALPLFR
jgi:hypothetical protein